MVKFKPGTYIRYTFKNVAAVGIIANYYDADGTVRVHHWYHVKWLYSNVKETLPVLLPGPLLEAHSEEDEKAGLFYS